jgi:hypothetical protein
MTLKVLKIYKYNKLIYYGIVYLKKHNNEKCQQKYATETIMCTVYDINHTYFISI